MAGFGTAGSVLTGGAVLFVLASAIIAFQGWPRVTSQTSLPAVTVNAAPAQPSRVSRRLRAVVVARRVQVAAPPAAAAGHRILAGTQRLVPSAPAGAISGPATGSLRSAALTEASFSRPASVVGG